MSSAIELLNQHLDAHAGRIGQAEVPMAMQALREFIGSGAALGRGFRRITGKCRPSDAYGTALVYLFVVVVDGAVHEGRLGPLEAYAASDDLLSHEAAELLALLTVMGRPTHP